MDILKSATKVTLIVLVLAVIVLNVFQIPTEEPLKTIATMVVSFYFGQKVRQNNDQAKEIL